MDSESAGASARINRFLSAFIYDYEQFKKFSGFFKRISDKEREDYVYGQIKKVPPLIMPVYKNSFQKLLKKFKSTSRIISELYEWPDLDEVIYQIWQKDIDCNHYLENNKKEELLSLLEFKNDAMKENFSRRANGFTSDAKRKVHEILAAAEQNEDFRPLLEDLLKGVAHLSGEPTSGNVWTRILSFIISVGGAVSSYLHKSVEEKSKSWVIKKIVPLVKIMVHNLCAKTGENPEITEAQYLCCEKDLKECPKNIPECKILSNVGCALSCIRALSAWYVTVNTLFAQSKTWDSINECREELKSRQGSLNLIKEELKKIENEIPDILGDDEDIELLNSLIRRLKEINLKLKELHNWAKEQIAIHNEIKTSAQNSTAISVIGTVSGIISSAFSWGNDLLFYTNAASTLAAVGSGVITTITYAKASKLVDDLNNFQKDIEETAKIYDKINAKILKLMKKYTA